MRGIHEAPEIVWRAVQMRRGKHVHAVVAPPKAPVELGDRHDLETGHAEIGERCQLVDREGRPIVAVGTTVVRTLEAIARTAEAGEIRPSSGATDLFLTPGVRFGLVTDLITNFHLPRSTLLMLVAAFAGRQPVLDAYAEAVQLGYRFYSYGDAMFLTGHDLAAGLGAGV